jgi:hypothetical protein
MPDAERKSEYITAATLSERCWTGALIKRFLPEADKTVANPYYKSAAPDHRLRRRMRAENVRADLADNYRHLITSSHPASAFLPLIKLVNRIVISQPVALTGRALVVEAHDTVQMVRGDEGDESISACPTSRRQALCVRLH